MTLLQTIIMSIVQGITELLPISSSGHLVLFSEILNIEEVSNFTLTSLHLGTTLAIVLFNWKFLFTNIKEKLKLYMFIVVATIPAGLIGVIFSDSIETYLRSTLVVALSLIIVGIIMIIVDRKTLHQKEIGALELEKVTFKQTLSAGFAQTLALIPGVSRSGITTIAGVFSGLNQYVAIRLSFILGIPILLGSFLYEMIKTDNSIQLITETNLIIAIAITFISGYASLWLLDKMSRTRFLMYFGVYRILLGIVIIISVII